MSSLSSLARIALSLGLPRACSIAGRRCADEIPRQGGAEGALRGGAGSRSRWSMSAPATARCSTMSRRGCPIRRRAAMLVEPIPYNQKRLRANYPGNGRFTSSRWR